jgi:hypothetical protein
MMFNATFNNISAISWLQFYWWRKLKYPEKTTDLPQVQTSEIVYGDVRDKGKCRYLIKYGCSPQERSANISVDLELSIKRAIFDVSTDQMEFFFFFNEKFHVTFYR